MNSKKAALKHFGIDESSVSQAIQDVRRVVTETEFPLAKANKIISRLTETDVNLLHELTAIHVLQGIVQYTINSDEFVNEEALAYGNKVADNIRVTQPWLFVESAITKAQDSQVQIQIEGIDISVPANKTGGIKKGGVKILTEELYKKHILMATPPMDNPTFVRLLVSELHVTLSCARTYASNAKNTFKQGT